MFLLPGAEITTYSAMCDGLALLEILYDFQNICSFLCHCHFRDISIWATGGLLIGLYSSSAEGTGRDFSPSKHSRVQCTGEIAASARDAVRTFPSAVSLFGDSVGCCKLPCPGLCTSYPRGAPPVAGGCGRIILIVSGSAVLAPSSITLKAWW